MRGVVCYKVVVHAVSFMGLLWLIILPRMTCSAHNVDTERLLKKTKSPKKKHGGLIFDKQGEDRSRILQFFEAPGATRKRDRISRKKRKRRPKRGPRPDSPIQDPPTEDPIAPPSITPTKEVRRPPRVSRASSSRARRAPRAPRRRPRAPTNVPTDELNMWPTMNDPITNSPIKDLMDKPTGVGVPTRPPAKRPSNAPIFTDSPTATEAEAPTISATNSPTIPPNNESTSVPTTSVPITELPTRPLTDTRTDIPTKLPTTPPSNVPRSTNSPTEASSDGPTDSPTIPPNNESTSVPTAATAVPITITPLTDTPTDVPTELPTMPPSNAPRSTNSPTEASSDGPTDSPTIPPNNESTSVPTKDIIPIAELPTRLLTDTPTDIPTNPPAKPPSNAPFSTDSPTMDDSPTGVPTTLTEVPTGAPITDLNGPTSLLDISFQTRSSEVESFLDVVLERSNATIMDFFSVDIDSLETNFLQDDMSPFDLYFEEVSAINQMHKDAIETDQQLFIERLETTKAMVTGIAMNKDVVYKDIDDFIQSTNEMIEAVEKTFQDQVCCFVSNLTEKIELPDDIMVFTQMLEVELNRIFLEFGVDVLLEEITIKKQGWLNASQLIGVDSPGTQSGQSQAQPIGKSLLALTLNATYKCGGYCVSSQEVEAAISDRLNTRLQPLSQYLLLNYAANNNNVPPIGNISISCHPCGGWNWADGFSKFIRTHMLIRGTTCTQDDLVLDKNPSEQQEERRSACEYKMKMLPSVMAQYNMRTGEYTNKVNSWTAEAARDIVAAARFRHTLELLEMRKNMKWVWDQSVSSAPLDDNGQTPIQVIEEEILYLGKEASFNDIECEIDGLTNETHSQSDSLKLAELFVAIFDHALLDYADITISELYVTQDCLLDDDGKCIIKETPRRRRQLRRRRIRRLQFKGGVTCRACRRRNPSPGGISTFWEMLNSQYAISIMENLGHLMEDNSTKAEVSCNYVNNTLDGIFDFWQIEHL
eukprot:scaffold18685_cov58-Attheya_sp.AAC.1